MSAGLGYVALGLSGFQAAMVWRNLNLYLPPTKAVGGAPPISILVPVRDEEENLPSLLESLREQRGVEWELVLVDDGSGDDTLLIARSAMARDARIRVFEAPTLPEGWAGKQHACYIASCQAVHDHWLFLDADVRLTDPLCLVRISSMLAGQTEMAMTSGLPRQRTVGWAEQTVIPLIHLVLLGFLPFWEMRRNRLPALGAACGQMIAIQAEAYRRTGGHSAVRHRLHDATALAALFRNNGYLTDMFDATGLADCRMYRRSRDVWDGFSKNATEGMAQPHLLPIWTVLLLGANLLPLLLALSGSRLGLLALFLDLVVYLALRQRFQQTLLGALSRPFGVLTLIVIQWWALLDKWRGGSAVWKGRAYQPRHQ